MTLPKDIADDLSEQGSATLGRDIMSSRPRGRRFAMRMFDLPTSHIYRLRIIVHRGIDLGVSTCSRISKAVANHEGTD